MSSWYEVNAPKRRRIGDDDIQLGQEHEVFLSFRGTDTRKGFTDYLFRSLFNAGVRVFRDNEKLHVGEEIGPQLIRGITQSKISIPIFSRNYADSKWCLKEFALMMECRKTMNQLVMPIFYDVTPNEVQHQTEKFQEAFARHEDKYGADTVQQWRAALSEVGSLKGWELEKAADGHEAELVEIVVKEVMKKLKKAHIVLKDTVIGIEEQVNAVMQLLEVGANDFRVIGIWGMGGIGKTTLANAVYNQILDQFECFGFLENIREKSSQHNGLESLQGDLVSKLSRNDCRGFRTVSDGIKELKDRFNGRKVLILLDDVDKKKQLEALGGLTGWFGRGSRIIVTTRDSGLFDKSRDKVYETKLMDTDRALQLFCSHAFKTDSPPSELRALSEDIVVKTGGLPLALEVIGGFLAGQEREVWESTKEKLQNKPHEEVEHTLKISYDALTEERKYFFLDIACFHIGEDVKVASYMWKDRFRFSPACDVRVLELMSLIKIERGKLWMHDQLRDFGRAVVERENEISNGKRIWLWKSETAVELLRECTELPRVEAISLNHVESETHFTDEQFRYLRKLRFIRLYGANLIGNFEGCLSNLRWLDWQHAPFKCIPTNLTLKNVVVLKLSMSCVEDDWNWSSMQALKVLDLSWCRELRRAPDFSFFPNLERLQLGGCSGLTEINSSIGKLKSLNYLDLGGCTELRRAPDFSFFSNLERLVLKQCSGLTEINSSIGKLKSLNYLNLWGCMSLEKLPDEVRSLTSLVELDVSYTGIHDLPISRHMKKLGILCANLCGNLSSIPNFIGDLTSLTDLRLGSCRRINELPESIGLLKKLQRLSLNYSSISELPESIGQLTSLVEFRIAGSKISALPKSIGNLEKLKVIDASGCPAMLGEFPDIERLCNLEVLKINGASISSLPETITSLSHLHTLHLDEPVPSFRRASSFTTISIPTLETLPELPISLISSVVTCRSVVPVPNLSHLTNLKELELHKCTGMMELLWDFANPLKLQKLCIVDCMKLRQIQTLPVSLLELCIEKCNSLEKIQGLGDLISLTNLKLNYCASLRTLPNISRLKSLKLLRLFHLEELHELEGLENLEVLEELSITGCEAIEKLPNLSSLKLLGKLSIGDYKKLQHLERLDGLEALKELSIAGCEAIEKLPNLSSLKLLGKLSIGDCKKLKHLEGLDGLEVLKELSIAGCEAIEKLPNLSSLKLLGKLLIRDCKRLQHLERLDGLEALKELSIAGCEAIEKLPNLSSLKLLGKLSIRDCKKLQHLQGLDGLEALKELCIAGCEAIEKLPNLSSLKLLGKLLICDCKKLQHLEGLDGLEALKELCIAGCEAIEKLPNLSSLKLLGELSIRDCKKLQHLEGLDDLEALKKLFIVRCEAIEKLPNLSSLKLLELFSAFKCEKLQDLEGLDGLEALQTVNVRFCKAIRRLPNLSNLKHLRSVNVMKELRN